jgi:small-conductance mechanosensitive channel
VVLATLSAVLALCADPDGLLLTFGVQPAVTVPLSLWSLFANLINYLLVAALFVGAFAFRRRRFPQQPYRGLLDFTRRVASLGTTFRNPAAGGHSR